MTKNEQILEPQSPEFIRGEIQSVDKSQDDVF